MRGDAWEVMDKRQWDIGFGLSIFMVLFIRPMRPIRPIRPMHLPRTPQRSYHRRQSYYPQSFIRFAGLFEFCHISGYSMPSLQNEVSSF